MRSSDLRGIIERTANIPADVFCADFGQVYDRVLDERMIKTLTDPSSTNGKVSIEQYRRRKMALTSYLDKRLICVCVRLPGMLYTIEVDPRIERVIYWEWQAT